MPAGTPSERTAPQLESMLALQRGELIRLHQLVDELRAKLSPNEQREHEDTVRRLETEVTRLRAALVGEVGWLSTGEASRLLSIHPNTLRKWVAAGKVACFRTPDGSARGGVRRYRRADIESARKWVSA